MKYRVCMAVALALLAGCVPYNQLQALDNEYSQLNARLSAQIAHDQVRITRMQGALKVALNSDLLFPSGG